MYGRIESCFIGIIGRDGELKTSRNGTPIINIPVAVGEKDQEPQWVTVAIFGETAEELEHRLKKGARCYFEGNLKLSHWRTNDGEQRISLDLAAWTCQPLGQIGRKRPKQRREPIEPQAPLHHDSQRYPFNDEVPL